MLYSSNDSTIFRASIHVAGGRLAVRSREVSKTRDSDLDFSDRSEICPAPRKKRWLDACRILER